MLFYDFEVFRYDWLTVILDMIEQKKYIFVNDQPALLEFYDEHKNDIWIGFNNKHYDDYILKGLLCDFDPYTVNDFIINQGRKGWEFSPLFRKIPLISYDVFQPKIDRGLKFFEGSLGSMIKESSIDFNIRRKLTMTEIEETIKYCTHDVEQTVEVFMTRKADFDAQLGLIKMFPETLSLSDLRLTKAQISAKILECEKVERDDEFELSTLPCIEIKKNKDVVKWFLDFRPDHLYGFTKEEAYECSLTRIISGVEHKFGWGGIHAGKEQYVNIGKREHKQIWHIDVASFYPRLMIFHNLLTRNCKRPDKFKQIYEKRIELKHAGKKKEQAPLKIVINGTYGISKSETSKAYDPRNANLICMNGQLMIVDLIEHLEQIKGFELIQSNTDGLIVSLPDTDEAFYQMDDICYEWESRCNMELEFDEINFIKQKDVNNYIFEFSNGKLERKGSYVKEVGPLDYDLPIVTKAVVNYLVKGIPAALTIKQCKDLKEFQMIRKISSLYSHLMHGGHWVEEKRINPKTGRLKTYKIFKGERAILKEKCVRVYASRYDSDGGLWKVKGLDKIEKVEGTPEHCFIVNEDVNGMTVPDRLNIGWYIKEAEKRIASFEGR